MSISRLLEGIADNKKWQARLELHRVFELWPELVGPDIAAAARPSLIRGRVLWVKVAESVWMQQLHLQKLLLLQKINSRLQGEKFTDIHFQLDSTRPPAPEPEPRKSKAVLPTKKEEQEIDRILSSIGNEDLRRSLKNLWIKIKTREK